MQLHGGRKGGSDGPRRRIAAAPNGLFTPLEETHEDSVIQGEASQSLEDLKELDDLVAGVSEGKKE